MIFYFLGAINFNYSSRFLKDAIFCASKYGTSLTEVYILRRPRITKKLVHASFGDMAEDSPCKMSLPFFLCCFTVPFWLEFDMWEYVMSNAEIIMLVLSRLVYSIMNSLIFLICNSYFVNMNSTWWQHIASDAENIQLLINGIL